MSAWDCTSNQSPPKASANGDHNAESRNSRRRVNTRSAANNKGIPQKPMRVQKGSQRTMAPQTNSIQGMKAKAAGMNLPERP